MANVDAPFGFWPVKSLSGHPWNGSAMKMYADATDSTAFYLGDPMVPDGDGCANACCMEAQLATAGDGNPWIGPLVGVDPNTSYTTIYRAASTARYLNVCVDPNMIYEVQCEGTLAATDLAANSNIILTHGGSTITGLSGAELDDTVGQNGSYQLLILGFVDREDNDLSADNGNWLVLNNLHSWKAVDANGDGAYEGAKGL